MNQYSFLINAHNQCYFEYEIEFKIIRLRCLYFHGCEVFWWLFFWWKLSHEETLSRRWYDSKFFSLYLDSDIIVGFLCDLEEVVRRNVGK